MTNEITEPTTQASALKPQPIGEQGPAAEALVSLIQMFGQLPGGYAKIHSRCTSLPVRLELQMDSPQDFEPWRTALAIAPSGVELKTGGGIAWLQADGVFHGVEVQLTGHGVELPQDQDEAPAVAA